MIWSTPWKSSGSRVSGLPKGRFGTRRENFFCSATCPGTCGDAGAKPSGVKEVMRPSNKCNGLTYDAQGNLLVCEHATSTLVRETPDGKRETIASHYQGKELNSPNDVLVGKDGSIYFSNCRLSGASRCLACLASANWTFRGRISAPAGRRRSRASAQGL